MSTIALIAQVRDLLKRSTWITSVIPNLHKPWQSLFNHSQIQRYRGPFCYCLKKIPPGGPHSTMDSALASHPGALGLILGIPGDLFLTEIFSLDVAEIHQQCTA